MTRRYAGCPIHAHVRDRGGPACTEQAGALRQDTLLGDCKEIDSTSNSGKPLTHVGGDGLTNSENEETQWSVWGN